MGARFLVPWRADGGHRERLWAHCHKLWAQALPDIPIVIGASPEGPFNRSAAINDAAWGNWDVGVVLDADVIANPDHVLDAIWLASSTGRVALPYDRFTGLNTSMTERILRGYAGDWERGARFRSNRHESSIVCIPRALWDEIGGFDERFVGWGQEDVAFIQAARVLGGGIERIAGTVFHLWHPRAPERDKAQPDYVANQALGERYRRTREPEAMRELLAERAKARRAAFVGIWEKNLWNGTETKAGPGSTLAATKELREWLPRVLQELGVASVLDAGCNDSVWMPELPGYIGVDIIPAALEVARSKHPDRDYREADICRDELPRCDAIICRDALQHLSLKDGLSTLNNFRRSGAKWLLASSHRVGENSDIRSGGYYACDLEAEPFWLGPPSLEIADGTWDGGVKFPKKLFGVWEL